MYLSVENLWCQDFSRRFEAGFGDFPWNPPFMFGDEIAGSGFDSWSQLMNHSWGGWRR